MTIYFQVRCNKKSLVNFKGKGCTKLANHSGKCNGQLAPKPGKTNKTETEMETVYSKEGQPIAHFTKRMAPAEAIVSKEDNEQRVDRIIEESGLEEK